ncbi:hypothetical protein CANINC_004444 [Pichia inconspicua]|uniref:Cleavage/polyadenylation specificity factor A subunit N-terminal domain-containing protein n=1 Tax=Pichia inconspicua TaxID=52247 RepID=A0A4T0WVA5_9ASCO|nr:hypothetical protein CANINC_004444 [[Candida] inconspicua]
MDQENGDIAWNRNTFLHSRLPTAVYFRFSIANRANRFSNLAQSYPLQNSTPGNLIKDGTFDWNFNHEEPKTVSFEINAVEKNDDYLEDQSTNIEHENEVENANMEKDDDDDDKSQDSINQSFAKQVTLLVYFSSISIDNSQTIPLPCQILTSTILHSHTQNGEDILALLLCNFEIVLIGFERNDNLEVIPFVVGTTDIPGLNLLHNNETAYKLNHSTANDLLFLTTSSDHCFVYNIVYEKNGIPLLNHSHNFTTGEMLLNCFIPISSNCDAFVSFEFEDDVLILRCISDLSTFKRSIVYFKNKFEIPIHMIPLKESNAVLLLQESGYTVKSLSFCIEGEELELTRETYPMSHSSIVNSYYIPSKPTDYRTFIKYDPSIYKHDQILISSTDLCVYVLDIFYHSKNHKFETRMKKLFQYKTNLTFFSFESTDVPGEFLLEFYNEMGLCEKRMLKRKNRTFELTNEYTSEVCHHPIFDFDFIEEQDKATIENHIKEIWVLSGTGINHSLMSFRHGLIARCTNLLSNLVDADRVYSYDLNKFWVCSDKRVILVHLGTHLNSLIPILEFQLEQPIVYCTTISNRTKFITSRNIMTVNIYGIERCCNLSHECILATGIEEYSVLLVKDDENKYSLYCEFMFEIKEISEFFTASVTNFSTITLLQFITFYNSIYLVVGTSKGEIFFYLWEDNHFTQTGVTVLSPASAQSISEYTFIPYQIHLDYDLQTLIITSYTGEYTMNKLILDRNYITGFDVLFTKKLADSSPLEIIKTKTSIYLRGLKLWEFDYNHNCSPKMVLMDDYTNDNILSAIPLHVASDENTFLALKGNNNVCILEVSLKQSMLSRARKIGVPCMKIKFIPDLKLFVLIRFQAINSSLPQLLFAEPRTLNVIKAVTDLEDLFKNMVPTSLHEWNIFSGDKKTLLLAIGCTHSNGEKGAMKIVKITVSENQIHLKQLHMISTSDPITHISVFYNRKNNVNHLLYSTGCTIKSCVYSLEEKRISSHTVFEGSEIIRKFYLTKDLDLHIVNQSQTCLMVKLSNMNRFKIIQKVYSTEMRTDVLPFDADTIVYNNVKEETLSVIRENTKILINVGYLPRFAKVNWLPPWISLRERSTNKYLQFITVGLGGEIDLFTLLNENHFVVPKLHTPKAISQLEEYTSSKLRSVHNLCGNITLEEIAYAPV